VVIRKLKRLAAFFVDGVIFTVAASPFYLLARSNDEKVICSILFSILWLFYRVFSHYYYKKTIGKKILRLALSSESGGQYISFPIIVIRHSVEIGIYLPYLLFLIWHYNETNVSLWASQAEIRLPADVLNVFWMITGYIFVLLNKNDKSIHDYLAGTQVICVDNIQKQPTSPPQSA